MKAISLVIPVYNVEAYLRRCLDSILTQHDVDLEVLLVNDGSTDHSREILQEYAERYPSLFTLLDKPNGGLGDARNYGAARASGEYLAFLDSDDFFEDNVLADLLAYAKKEQADLVNFDFYWYYSDDQKEVRSALPKEFQEMNKQTYLLSNPCAWNKLIRRSCYEANHTMFPPRLWYEDIATTPAYVLVCEKLVYYRQPLVNYRQRPNSITSKNKFSERVLEIKEAMAITIQALKGSAYQSEIEYLSIFQLCYFASFRFLEFDQCALLEECLTMLADTFPNWRQNAYYRQKPFAFRLYCESLMKHHYRFAKLLMKVRG